MDHSSDLYAIILGIVQGLTEFLPVSSSGHLIIVSWLMDGKPLPLSLNIALHLGTLSAVIIFFWKDWLKLAQNTANRVLKNQKSFESDILLPALLVGSVPAGVVGLLWKDPIQAIFHNPLFVTIPLAVVGLLLWWLDLRATTRKCWEDLTLIDAIIIGCAQACALIPGVSRSGATIIAGRQLGFSRADTAKFSFLLGTPAMGGAALLYGKELLAHLTDSTFIIGFFVSCAVGCLAINYFLKFVKSFGFIAFAIYRCIVAAIILFLVLSN